MCEVARHSSTNSVSYDPSRLPHVVTINSLFKMQPGEIASLNKDDTMHGMSQKITNQQRHLHVYSQKLDAFSSAATQRLAIQAIPCLAKSKNCAPSVNAYPVRLQECEEECDGMTREAKLAFRSTDLDTWASSFKCEINTNWDPENIQHWALVVHFTRGKKTYLFEAWLDESNGLLQASRAENVAYEVFENATYFATIETCPSELLEKAKRVSTGPYDVLFNNCQTWLREFLDLISPGLLSSLYEKIPTIEM